MEVADIVSRGVRYYSQRFAEKGIAVMDDVTAEIQKHLKESKTEKALDPWAYAYDLQAIFEVPAENLVPLIRREARRLGVNLM